ncbi:hypothetical protein AB1L42_02625 [Thalassoglobus sp. JC818]|uniref:hypothetical protein n=1 Tax=Thalassoglobus sp. JC818 TaxID=3232136 RepID=UPI00345851E5
MKVHQFLDHYGITENPYAQEDASSDRVFIEHCLTGTYHSGWDKIYGDPRAPSTSVVFGEQGSGKTALRLQIAGRLREFNETHPEERAFTIHYDNFNPFLDSFRERLHGRRRKAEKALQNWKLWDHMDAILTLATTRLADIIRNGGVDAKDPSQSVDPAKIDDLKPNQRRDILLLATFYDQNRDESAVRRWNQLRRKLKVTTWKSYWDIGLGAIVTLAIIGGVFQVSETPWSQLFSGWTLAIIIAAWLPAIWNFIRNFWTATRAASQVRISDQSRTDLRRILARFDRSQISGQPLPTRARGDDRYELLHKLQSVLTDLGFQSIVVLVDRVDEPHLVNGSPERMRDLIWPLFDNKFLKHPGIAFKLLLPAALSGFLNRQEKEFYERSRLDKQNLIPSLNWTGQGLYDVANDRLRACAKLAENRPSISDLFDDSISEQELITVFDRLRAPRHLFKYLYRLFIDHCSKHTEDSPEWKIQRETMQSSLAVFMKDLDAYDQKLGTG